MRDRDVRDAVLDALRAQHARDADTRIVEEMGIWSGSVRVDIAVINGELCGYELKSDQDTLARLAAQEDLYSRVFDRVTLVVGERHFEKAQPRVPAWWGITVARAGKSEVALAPIRPAQRNSNIDALLVARLLWREEALAVLNAHGLATGWRSKAVPALHARLAAELPLTELTRSVRETLKLRERWLG